MNANGANGSGRGESRPSAENLAVIAAALLDGENYRDAARRALALFDACREELAGAPVDPFDRLSKLLDRPDSVPAPASVPAVGTVPPPPERATGTATPPTPPRRKRTPPAVLDFQGMVNHVTGRTGSDAEKGYAGFLRWHIRAEKAPIFAHDTAAENMAADVVAVLKMPEPEPKEVQARIAAEKKQPFSRENVEYIAGHFDRWQVGERSRVRRENGRQGGRGKKKTR